MRLRLQTMFFFKKGWTKNNGNEICFKQCSRKIQFFLQSFWCKIPCSMINLFQFTLVSITAVLQGSKPVLSDYCTLKCLSLNKFNLTILMKNSHKMTLHIIGGGKTFLIKVKFCQKLFTRKKDFATVIRICEN